MAELLEIDGLNLRGQGFGASTRTGRYNLPALRGENLVLPGASGARFVPKAFEEGTGVLTCWAIGATQDANGNLSIPATMAGRRQAFEDNMNHLIRLFTRPHRLSTIRAAQPDSSIRRALVEWIDWSEPEVMAGGTRAEFTMGYTIPTVWWEDETTTTQTAPAGATLPKTMDLTSFSNMTGFIDDATLTVVGPISNPKITDSETGAFVTYNGTVATGSSWVVNVATFSSTIGASSVLSSTTHTGGYKLLTIPNCFVNVDTPRLVLSGSAGAASTTFSVTARRKWATG